MKLQILNNNFLKIKLVFKHAIIYILNYHSLNYSQKLQLMKIQSLLHYTKILFCKLNLMINFWLVNLKYF